MVNRGQLRASLYNKAEVFSANSTEMNNYLRDPNTVLNISDLGYHLDRSVEGETRLVRGGVKDISELASDLEAIESIVLELSK